MRFFAVELEIGRDIPVRGEQPFQRVFARVIALHGNFGFSLSGEFDFIAYLEVKFCHHLFGQSDG
ncbi:MAG TPA: hypothetical protein VG891_08590 [Rhizomicrobium sp.]|nr:hypothetical protein [Rhizomicrobium sp.]